MHKSFATQPTQMVLEPLPTLDKSMNESAFNYTDLSYNIVQKAVNIYTQFEENKKYLETGSKRFQPPPWGAHASHLDQLFNLKEDWDSLFDLYKDVFNNLRDTVIDKMQKVKRKEISE